MGSTGWDAAGASAASERSTRVEKRAAPITLVADRTRLASDVCLTIGVNEISEASVLGTFDDVVEPPSVGEHHGLRDPERRALLEGPAVAVVRRGSFVAGQNRCRRDLNVG